LTNTWQARRASIEKSIGHEQFRPIPPQNPPRMTNAIRYMT
jgi:hypothetical protein